jgi:hypothetical protein
VGIMSDQGTSDVLPTAEAWVPLTFEAWAALSARMMNLSEEERLDILDAHPVEPDDWRRCEEHYVHVLAGDVGQGRMERAELYARTCVAEVERRGNEVAASPSPASEEDRAPMAEPTAPVAAPQAAVPSFMHAAVGAAHASPRYGVAAEFVATAMAFELPSALRPKLADALPFHGSSEPSLAASPTEQQPAAPPPGAGETIDVGVNLMALVSAPLPFGQALTGPEPVPGVPMPLQTYASFCAELAVFPQNAAEIGRKYHVPTQEARDVLEREWRSRLEAHPDMHAEWQKLFSAYRDWLLQQPR